MFETIVIRKHSYTLIPPIFVASKQDPVSANVMTFFFILISDTVLRSMTINLFQKQHTIKC